MYTAVDYDLVVCLFVFQDACDANLERLREQELSKTALVIQSFMRGYKDRCGTFKEE